MIDQKGYHMKRLNYQIVSPVDGEVTIVHSWNRARAKVCEMVREYTRRQQCRAFRKDMEDVVQRDRWNYESGTEVWETDAGLRLKYQICLID
jgi:hypothetical protein